VPGLVALTLKESSYQRLPDVYAVRFKLFLRHCAAEDMCLVLLKEQLAVVDPLGVELANGIKQFVSH